MIDESDHIKKNPLPFYVIINKVNRQLTDLEKTSAKNIYQTDTNYINDHL